MFYLNLFQTLKTHQVDYLLVGGLAMNLHGVPRMTMDVDLVIALDASNVAKLAIWADELGLYPSVPVPLVDLADAAKRELLFVDKHLIALSLISKMPATPTVDIVIHHPLDFQRAFAKKVARDISGTPVMLASIEDMIAMKKAAGRAQDLSDISHLERFLHEKTSNNPAIEPNGFSYYVTDEQMAAFAKLTMLERLQWVDEARLFTLMTQTPETRARHELLRKGAFHNVTGNNSDSK